MPAHPRSSEPPFVSDLLAALAERGPLTTGQLAAELEVGEAALTLELCARGDVVETQDGWRSVWALADGVVLTHLADEQELELGLLAANGDLDLWARLADEGLPMAGGGEVHVRYRADLPDLPEEATTALVGPPGWLSDCPAGQLLGLRLTAGTLNLETYDDLPAVPPEQVQLLLGAAMVAADAALDEEDEDGPGMPLDDVVLDVLLHEPTALHDPLPPLSALVALAGLEVVGGLVGLPGSDWDGRRPCWLDRDQRHQLARVRAVLLMVGIHDEALGSDPQILGETATVLAADSEVLAALAAELAVAPSLFSAVQALAAAGGEPGERAAATYLLAVAADAAGEVTHAQQHLDEALAATPDLVPALILAAHYAAERGDAFAADRFYRQAGQDNRSPWRSQLREFLQAPPGVSGRNRPCGCGSGRKTKLCCGARALHPLPRRALWRYRRALTFVLHPAQQPVLLDLAGDLAGPYGEIEDALSDPLPADLALVEGGVLASYLDQRGVLMPADEVALVEGWLDTPLALLEVIGTRPGREVTLRELPDGEPQIVRDRLLSSDVEPLDLLLGRLLFDGESRAFMTSPRRVPRERRRVLLDVLADDEIDPQAIAVALATAGPPQLHTREGEEVVVCTARYAVADLDAAWQALAAELEDDDEDLVEFIDLDGDQVLRGRLRRVEGGLEIETNSLERLRRLQHRVLTAAPTARLVTESSIPAAELMGADAQQEPQSSELPSELAAELLASYGEQAEQRWLDESIPALGGRTPRQAAADPAGRRELEALLDDFAWRERRSDQPSVMQAARLRTALGLPTR